MTGRPAPWPLVIVGLTAACASAEPPDTTENTGGAGTALVGGSGRAQYSGGAWGRAGAIGSSRGGAPGTAGGSNSVAGRPTVPPEPKNSFEVQFTPWGGTFTSSLTVSLSTQVPGAAVHYTRDGTPPTPASPVYDGPIELTRSTRLRAVAVTPQTGNGPVVGPSVAQAYLRITPDAAAFTSHLPVVVINTWEAGPLGTSDDEPHVPATLQLFEPVAGKTSLVGQAALDTRIGIHVRGESSRAWPKKQYAVEFRDSADQDLDLPWLGMPAGADWVISDPLTMDRSSIRNAFVYAVSNSIGRYAPRTRFVEGFLINPAGDGESGGQTGEGANSGGDLSMASFMGLYTMIEKIERGIGRVDLAKLTEKDLREPEISGGYIIRIDKGDSDFYAAGAPVQFVYPRSDVMSMSVRKPQVEFIRSFIDSYYLAASAADFKHPSTGQHYSEFIDLDAWIDHHIINAFTKNPDAIKRSAYLYKDKGGKLTAGPAWDYDRSLGTPEDSRVVDPEGWSRGFNDPWWKPLWEDLTFQERYRARTLALLQSELSYPKLEAIIDQLVAEVGGASARNYQRWLEEPRSDAQAEDVAIMKDWIKKRLVWFEATVREVPFR